MKIEEKVFHRSADKYVYWIKHQFLALFFLLRDQSDDSDESNLRNMKKNGNPGGMGEVTVGTRMENSNIFGVSE